MAISSSSNYSDEAATPILTDMQPWLEYYLFPPPLGTPAEHD